MSEFKRKFLKFLTEDENVTRAGGAPMSGVDPDISALKATPEDDARSFENSLDNPESKGDFEEVIEPSQDYHRDLDLLESWIENIDKFKRYLNGGKDSILNKLKDEAKVGTIFDDLSNATKKEILDIAERLAGLNEELKNVYMEKHK